MNTIHLGEIQDNDDDRTSNLDNVDGVKYSDASLSTAEQVDTLRSDYSSSINSNSSNNNRLAFLPVRTASMGSSKGGGSVYSRSSKISVRRRDVIKPVAIALPPPPTAAAAVVDDNDIDNNRIAVLVPSNKNQEAATAIKASSMQWTMMPSNPQAGCTDNNNELAMVVHGQPLRGMEPPETSKASYGCDPPEYDDDDNDDMNNNSIIYRNRYKHISWVDPKSISQNDIDYDTLRKYRQLSGNDVNSSHYDNNDNYYYKNTVDTNQQRVRIATISSGYKTARFFVREDLDQRIYFHELEDAVSYMARRGYARMEKGMEREWMGLLKKAHEVVKVGRTKKKQRYRKGKLVLIMYKPIKDETVDHYSDVPKNKSSSNDNESVTSDAETAHTSLGRSIRCGYKSYSEKFIAQHMNGAANGVLLLTNGTTNSSNNNNASSGLLQITNGTTSSSSNNNNMSYIQEEGEEGSESTPASEKKRGVYGGGVRYFTPDKSYSEDGDEGSDEEEDDQDDNASQESEEEDNKSASDDYLEVEGSDMGSFLSDEEDDTYNRPSSGVSSVVDEEENSTINSEMSSIDRNVNNSGTGVYMAKNRGNVGMGNTLNKKRAPTPFDKSPGMVSISSESDSEA